MDQGPSHSDAAMVSDLARQKGPKDPSVGSRVQFSVDDWSSDSQPDSAIPSGDGWPTDTASNEGSSGGADPSDPTQVVFHVTTEFEWTKLRDGGGDLEAFKISPFIPLTLGEQKFLFNVEVPIPQLASTDLTGDNAGIGDTRLKLFWLIGTENEFVRAIVPSFDAIAPTGDDGKGTGGGAWILMPNMVFALQPKKNLSIYPFFRYVHSSGPRSAFVPDAGLPGIGDAPDFLESSAKINGLNLETMIVFGLEDAFADWVGITPDYFQNFSGNHSNTFQMKYDVGIAVREKIYLILAFWHPVGGEVTNDFTMKLTLDWYF